MFDDEDDLPPVRPFFSDARLRELLADENLQITVKLWTGESE